MAITYKQQHRVQPRYSAFIKAHGKGHPMWQYMAFIDEMKRLYFGVSSTLYHHIQDHDDFTKFVCDNAHRYTLRD